uniref:Uncharacterized protein n=1 Tax=Cacopsylla melanoneura TaxID=428564 RepID=A0A8D9EF73_9HEMI
MNVTWLNCNGPSNFYKAVDTFTTQKIDIICLSETWLRSYTKQIPGYKTLQVEAVKFKKKGRFCGGQVMLCNESYEPIFLRKCHSWSFICIKSLQLIVGSVYIKPGDKKEDRKENKKIVDR